MGFRLIDAKVQVRPADVVLTYVMDSDQPPTDDFYTFSTTFLGPEGEYVRQVGFKIVDGDLSAAFSFDHASSLNHDYSVTPGRTGDTWTIVFPRDALGGATGDRWRADLDVAGVDGGPISSHRVGS